MKKLSILKQLRNKYPEQNFRAERTGYGIGWKYIGDSETVQAFSQLAPKYDADDESCIIVYKGLAGKQYGAEGVIF